MMMPNVVYCAFTSARIGALPSTAPVLSSDQVVSRVAVTREQLDHGAWHILGQGAPVADKADFSNEAHAGRRYVGAKIYDAALAEEFLAAFHALTPWDDFHDPQYLDAWLTRPECKPLRLLYKSDAPAS